MAERIFNIEKFQSYWDSLTVEQRSPAGWEAVLDFAEERTQMRFVDQNGNTMGPVWHFATDVEGNNRLLHILQYSGIPVGELDDYWVEETMTEENMTDETLADETLADNVEPEPQEQPETQEQPQTRWVPYEPEESTASVVGKTLLKTVAIVGGVYMAYRMTRRPWA